MNKDTTPPKESPPSVPSKPTNEKTFYFSKEEQDFLVPRQILKNDADILSGDMDFIMKNFVINVVCKRLGIDIQTSEVNFNLADRTIKVTPKIIVPKVIVPPSKK